jgi:hypothetical protein
MVAAAANSYRWYVNVIRGDEEQKDPRDRATGMRESRGPVASGVNDKDPEGEMKTPGAATARRAGGCPRRPAVRWRTGGPRGLTANRPRYLVGRPGRANDQKPSEPPRDLRQEWGRPEAKQTKRERPERKTLTRKTSGPSEAFRGWDGPGGFKQPSTTKRERPGSPMYRRPKKPPDLSNRPPGRAADPMALRTRARTEGETNTRVPAIGSPRRRGDCDREPIESRSSLWPILTPPRVQWDEPGRDSDETGRMRSSRSVFAYGSDARRPHGQRDNQAK